MLATVSFLDLIALALAAGAVVNAWLLPDGLFESLRERIDFWAHKQLQARAYSLSQPTRLDEIKDLLSHLINCRICMTYHAAFWLFVLFIAPSLWVSGPCVYIIRAPVYILAAVRISLLISLIIARWHIENDHENA